MEQWLESVYSDGTKEFVSNPAPRLMETVTVRVRFYDDAPVRSVILRTVPNGGEVLRPMRRGPVRNGLVYYEAELTMTETRMQYQFYLATEDRIYFYTQNGITTFIPDQTYDFVLLTDYVQPAWVKEAVFYQIFPDRFCNGDPANDVRDGEYSVQGHPTIRMQRWDAPALTYQQGFCLDFYGGDLQGIKEKIPYLKELGVTALYLNPIFTAPSVHKYDCIDYFHVDPHFGGDEALAELSAALHENGMRLILDISINHTGDSHKWFNRDCAWFPESQGAFHNPQSEERSYYFFRPDGSYKGWWDLPGLPVLNYTSEKLRDVIYRAADSVLKKWLKPPYSIDGWRFDVADVFARNNEIQLAHTLWPEIRTSIRAENPQAYILAEDWGDCAPYLQGTEWDSPMNYYGCGRVIRQFVGEQDPFLGRRPELAGIPPRMTAEEVRSRVMQHLAKLPFAFWQNQFNLIDSHDISRLHNNPKVSSEAYRAAVMLQFMLIGAPSIYYGDEAGVDGVLGTNEGCRYPMPWQKNFTDTEQYRLYHTLTHLRLAHPALTRGGMCFLFAENGILALARFREEESFVLVISKEKGSRQIRLPLGVIGAQRPGTVNDVFGRRIDWTALDRRSVLLNVPANSALLFSCTQL